MKGTLLQQGWRTVYSMLPPQSVKRLEELQKFYEKKDGKDSGHHKRAWVIQRAIHELHNMKLGTRADKAGYLDATEKE